MWGNQKEDKGRYSEQSRGETEVGMLNKFINKQCTKKKEATQIGLRRMAKWKQRKMKARCQGGK